MDTEELRVRDRIIAHDCNSAERRDLEYHLEVMSDTQLALLCNRFGLPLSEDWHDVLDGIWYQTWSEVIAAIEQITGRSY